jgi:outer membrane protein assembly factor BamB
MNILKNEEKSELFSDSKDSEDFSSVKYLTDKEFTRNSILICSTHGNIYAIHKSNGKRIWSKKFPSGAMGGVVSLFVTDDDKLIAGAKGKTACMNLMTGETLWINKMPASDHIYLFAFYYLKYTDQP